MIAAAFQYSGLGIILGMLLVTAVIVLCERRDHDLDADQDSLNGSPRLKAGDFNLKLHPKPRKEASNV